MSKKVPDSVAVEPLPKEGETDSAEKELRVIFADRLTQITDRRPDVIRTGRGRVNDFADKFNVHYTTAYRLLSGDSLPSASMLCQLADKFDVTESWLLGRGPSSVSAMLEEDNIRIHAFTPREERPKAAYISVTSSVLPVGIDTSKLIYTRVVGGDGQEEGVIVKLTNEAQDGKVHLLYEPTRDRVFLRRLMVHSTKNIITALALTDGSIETIDLADLVFGETKGNTKTCILGPVVARLTMGYDR